jgi:hypothetical protein
MTEDKFVWDEGQVRITDPPAAEQDLAEVESVIKASLDMWLQHDKEVGSKMGGKPSKGTPKDQRLKRNNPTSKKAPPMVPPRKGKS